MKENPSALDMLKVAMMIASVASIEVLNIRAADKSVVPGAVVHFVDLHKQLLFYGGLFPLAL